MRFLRGLFGAKEDPLVNKALGLMTTAHINAVTMLTPLLDRFPIIEPSIGDDVENWDFVFTMAGIVIAMSRLESLSGKLEDALIERIDSLVTMEMIQWRPDSLDAYEDCRRLWESEVDRLEAAGHAPDFLASDALGMWIVLNALKRQPRTDEEFQLVRLTGLSITNTFYDWWEE